MNGNESDKSKRLISSCYDFDYVAEQWRQKLREYTPWFNEQEEKKANEALRPGAPKTADDLFGMDGTFRKLTID